MNPDLATVVTVPTLWRSTHLAPFLDSLHANVRDIPVRALFLAQDGDDPTLDELERLGADYTVFPTVDGAPMSMVAKCNEASRQVTEPFLFGASDDIRIQPGCLERCHDALADPDVHVACVSDGIDGHSHDGELTGHCLVRMSYVREHSLVLDEPNVLMHSGYYHYYSDLELMKTACRRGCYVSLFDARIDHPHPNNGTAPRDRVQQMDLERMGSDRRVYESRRHLWEAA